MSQQSQNSPSSSGSELTGIYCIAGFLILFFLLKHYFKEYFDAIIFHVKFCELLIINTFSHHYDKLIETISINSINVDSFVHFVGNIIRWPISILLLIMGVILFFWHPSKYYTEKDNTDSLLKKMNKQFPASAIISNKKLYNVPLDDRIWGMGLSPKAFLLRHNLYRDEFNEDKLSLLLETLLGDRWTGFDGLDVYLQGLLLVFIFKSKGKGKESQVLLKLLARIFSSEKKIERYKLMYQLNKIIDSHCYEEYICTLSNYNSYTYTVMINEYNLAKEKGVLAPAEFLWLKSKDRTLWYALQNLGRKSFFIEGASAHYHWSIEHKVNKKIEFPVLDNLVDSLRRKNEKYK